MSPSTEASAWTNEGLPPATVDDRIAAELARLSRSRAHVLGFPAATDLDYSPVTPLAAHLINQLGDPERPGPWPQHVFDLERDVVASGINLFGGHPDQCWGYVTSGATEAMLHSLWTARERLPGAQVYFSSAAHYCATKTAQLLDLPFTPVDTDAEGRMRPDQLARAVAARPARPAIVVATWGTTMTEACDNLADLHRVLDDARVPDRHVIVDAAFSGLGLALDGGSAAQALAPPTTRQPTHADAVFLSGHKVLGTPRVCALVLTRRAHVPGLANAVGYIGGQDVTVGGSRDGLAVTQLWWALNGLGRDRHRDRIRAARAVAEHAVRALFSIDWPAWRFEHALTVVLDPPPAALCDRWALPVAGGVSHLICVPGVTAADVDTFVAELHAATRATTR